MSLFAWYNVLFGCGHVHQDRYLRLKAPRAGFKKVCPICGRYTKVRIVETLRMPTA